MICITQTIRNVLSYLLSYCSCRFISTTSYHGYSFLAGWDNSRTYVPEVRQYYGLVYFFVFSQVPRRYAELLLSAHLLFAGTIWPYQTQWIQTVIKTVYGHVWHVLARNIIGLMGLSLRNESILVFVYAVVILLVLTRCSRLPNEYLSETCTLCINTHWVLCL
jgi:hypothetical protein